jgi:hypothetical protein
MTTDTFPQRRPLMAEHAYSNPMNDAGGGIVLRPATRRTVAAPAGVGFRGEPTVPGADWSRPSGAGRIDGAGPTTPASGARRAGSPPSSLSWDGSTRLSTKAKAACDGIGPRCWRRR